MDVNVISDRIEDADADALIVPYIQDGEAWIYFAETTVNDALGGAIRDLLDSGDFSGKAGQVSLLYPRGLVPAKRVILVGLFSDEGYTPDTIRRSMALAVRKAAELKAARIAVSAYGPYRSQLSTELIVEAALLAAYNYNGQKKSPAPELFPQILELIVDDENRPDVEAGVASGKAVAAGVITARNLVNQPPNVCTPAYMAETAAALAAQVGLNCEALEPNQIEALNMGALLNVARGSDTPPRFIILEHNADRAAELDTIVLVGKGVTFDTGGYSIKTTEGMVGMKADMAGGAAVIGAMQAIGALNVPLHVVGLIPAADNMISGHSYRPQEVITASNGVTIEIISTDAEGRLLLADALVFASRYKPAAVVDIATLTGACVVALGTVAGGLFSSDDTLRDALMASAARTNEKLWPLPMFPEYDKDIESQAADIKNSGGRYGGASIGAVFLKHFVDYPLWAHIDMAGLAGIDSLSGKQDNPYVPAKGATGYGTRLLIDFVRSWQP